VQVINFPFFCSGIGSGSGGGGGVSSFVPGFFLIRFGFGAGMSALAAALTLSTGPAASSGS